MERLALDGVDLSFAFGGVVVVVVVVVVVELVVEEDTGGVTLSRDNSGNPVLCVCLDRDFLPFFGSV